jgi:Domain of unknown function (DUF1083).
MTFVCKVNKEFGADRASNCPVFCDTLKRGRLLWLLLFVFVIPFTQIVARNKSSRFRQVKDSVSKPVVKPLREYNTHYITHKPKIDGHLNDSCWQTGEWADDFVQWIPKEGAKASQPTYLKILYDDKNIYVGIRAIDNEPRKIQRKAARRDILSGDVTGVSFDSYHDRRTGFEFDVTAAGQKLDGINTNPWNTDLTWNAVWYAKTALEDSAWTAEMAIPFSQLRYSRSKEQVWGLHCWRWISRLKEESDWEPQSSTGPGILYAYGLLKGLNNLPKSKRFEMIASGLGKIKTFKRDPLNPFANKGYTLGSNIGLDAKIGLTSNFTVDMTINPDFGQVEADPSEINLTAFETFFTEKRPFFLEGKNIFAFDVDDVNLFYSRRIGHTPSYTPDLADNEYLKKTDNATIIDAVKVSGKTEKGLTLGILQSTTSNESDQLSTSTGQRSITVEPLTNYFLARVQQDFKQGNTVLGGIFTSTNRFIHESQLNFLNRNAYTGGFDLLHQWRDKEFYLDAKMIGSYITGSRQAMQDMQQSSARYLQRPDISYAHYDSTRNSLSGWGGDVKIGKGSKGLWRYYTELSFRSPGLELNDMGYMQTADIIKQNNYLAYFVNKPVSIFRTYTWIAYMNNNWDYGCHYLSTSYTGVGYVEFLNKWSINNSLTYTSNALDTRILRGGAAMYVPANLQENIYIKTDDSKAVYLSLNYIRTFPNLQGKSSYYSTTLTTQPCSLLKLSLNFNYALNNNQLQYVDAVKYGNVSIPILATINQKTLGATFRADCNLTPELSLQYYGSPYSSVGKYSVFKRVTDPRNKSFEKRFTLLDTSNYSDDAFSIDENGDGKTDYSVSNPDFNYYQFRSNFVLRWEYRAGSQLYFVWSNEITSYQNPSHEPVTAIFRGLSKGTVNNVFLVKLSYWFSL